MLDLSHYVCMIGSFLYGKCCKLTCFEFAFIFLFYVPFDIWMNMFINNTGIEAVCHTATISISMNTCKYFKILMTHHGKFNHLLCPNFFLFFSYEYKGIYVCRIIRFLKSSGSTLHRPRKHRLNGREQLQKAYAIDGFFNSLYTWCAY